MLVRRPARVDGKPTVSGHYRLAIRRLLYATRQPVVNGSKLKQYELYEHDIVYMYITHFIFSLVSNSNLNSPTIIVQK